MPLNDGGLFYSMCQDLLAANFRLPLFLSYNHLNIPAVYPPLSIYLLATAYKFTHLDLLFLIRFLPALFSSFALLPFYFLARRLIPHPKIALLALAIFSYLPVNFEQQIMGGGISRAPGMFFAILFLWSVSYPKTSLLASSVFLSLTILTHPQWAAFAICSGFILFASRSNLLTFIKIFVFASLLISPWWLTIIATHGLTPFISALTATSLAYPTSWGFDLLFTIGLISSAFTYPRLFIWYVFFTIIGLRNLYTLTGPQITTITALNFYLLSQLPHRLIRISLSCIAVSLLLVGIVLSNTNLFITLHHPDLANISTSDLAAFSWIKSHTPFSSRFLVISNTSDPTLWGYDQISEWFPALTARTSLTTPQGTEWLPHQKYLATTNAYIQMKTSPFKFISTSSNYDYLYLQDKSSFALPPSFKLVYQNSSVFVYTPH
jgi:hypothetical protein